MTSASPPENVEQPESFDFTPENVEKAKALIAKYPEGREASAVLPLLDLAQRQHGWVPQAAMDRIAGMLDMAPIRIYEVATFYTMINRAPVGRNFLQVCTTTPCWLCGSDDVLRACRDVLGIGPNEMTEDGAFSVLEVECLGACVNAPMIQVNDDYYEDLDYERTKALLEALQRGETPAPGPMSDRTSSEPAGKLTSLTTIKA